MTTYEAITTSGPYSYVLSHGTTPADMRCVATYSGPDGPERKPKDFLDKLAPGGKV